MLAAIQTNKTVFLILNTAEFGTINSRVVCNFDDTHTHNSHVKSTAEIACVTQLL